MIPKRLRDKLAERSGGVCEVCGIAAATNWHHRKNRSQGGADELSNALHLCGSGTTGCHGRITTHPQMSYDRGWSVRRNFDPAEVPALRHGEWVLLDGFGGVFKPPQGRDRCVRCGFHMPTQGHRNGCQSIQARGTA